ncbi:hypothetical protein TNCV_4640761 [Trichonephila clavipes]|nr:hypothetical protein TNCV_4640761 [Trichonephila clavipes]
MDRALETRKNFCEGLERFDSPLKVVVVEGIVMEGMAGNQRWYHPLHKQNRIPVLLPSMVQIDNEAALLNGL